MQNKTQQLRKTTKQNTKRMLILSSYSKRIKGKGIFGS